MRGSDTVTLRKRKLGTERDRLNQKTPLPDQLIIKAGCLVEIQRPLENAELAMLASEVAWIFLPVDSDTRGIASTDAIDFSGRTYEMRGPGAIERTIDGEEVQVWCTAQWQGE